MGGQLEKGGDPTGAGGRREREDGLSFLTFHRGPGTDTRDLAGSAIHRGSEDREGLGISLKPVFSTTASPLPWNLSQLLRSTCQLKTGRESEQTCLQRRYTEGRQTDGKGAQRRESAGKCSSEPQ